MKEKEINDEYKEEEIITATKEDKELEQEEDKAEEDKKAINKFGLIEERRRNNKTSTFKSQSFVSIKKNLIIFKRHYKTTLLLFSTPLIIAAILIFLQWCLDTWSSTFTKLNPETENLGKISKCPSPNDCLTIMTIIIDKSNNTENKEEATKIMKYVADNNDLEFDKDIIISNSITNYTQFSNYLDENKNKTYYGVVFCYDYLDTEFYDMKVNIPCKPQFRNEDEEYRFYTIVYNVTNCPNDFLEMPYEPRNKDIKLTKLKMDIDNAFLEIFHVKYGDTSKPTPKINISIADFPQTEMRFFKGTSVVNNFGAPFFMLIPITLFILLLVDIVKEKQYLLRKSLIIIGMTNGAFWTGWIVIALLFSLIMVTFFLILSLLLGWELFINVPFPIVFVLFYSFYLDLQFLAFFLATIISNIKTAYATAFLVIVVSAVIQGVFTVPFIYQIIFSNQVGWGAFFFKIFLYIFAPYSFSKAYIEIATISTTKLNEITLTNTKGRRYYYSDLFEKHEGNMLFINTYYNIPPTYESFIVLFLDGLLYLLLAWYFDNILEQNRGKGKSPIFFIYKIGRLFGYCKKKRKLDNSDSTKGFQKLNENTRNTFFNDTFRPTIASNEEFLLPEEDNSKDKLSIVRQKGYNTVLDELNKIKNDEKNNIFLDGLRIVGASKTYNLANGKKLKALENIFFDVSRGELLTLLGHNGAGKTTLINALCGNIPITSGYAIINEVNITDENIKSKYKRQLIGLCPQHDILWSELTPMEHIELYARIRNYDYRDVKDIGIMKMKEVNLEHVMNEQVGTFSGGMKRRISILLSTIGNPNVVFLDEPSTGLDPVNRRFIWDMIKEIKKKSSVILTTHSMNEAEYLSDRICIIQKGKMQCIGSSLDLKSIFGEGYILTFVCEKNKEDTVKEIITGICPDIKLISSKGGSLIFSLPFEKLKELNWFIKILNKDYSDENLKPLKRLIFECGIEQTSIEEIFLKIGKGDEEDASDEIKER